MTKTEYHTCDIKGCKNRATPLGKARSRPVVFLTETTESGSCKPYLDYVSFDLCDSCYQKFIDLFPIQAVGAQGYNEYTFKALEAKG